MNFRVQLFKSQLASLWVNVKFEANFAAALFLRLKYFIKNLVWVITNSSSCSFEINGRVNTVRNQKGRGGGANRVLNNWPQESEVRSNRVSTTYLHEFVFGGEMGLAKREAKNF